MESIPGFGQKSIEYIYKRFKSLSQITKLDKPEIEASIGVARTNSLFNYLFESEGTEISNP